MTSNSTSGRGPHNPSSSNGSKPQMEGKGFFLAFLRPPFRKPAPKTVAVARPCKKGPCSVPCSPGQARDAHGGCVPLNRTCPAGQHGFNDSCTELSRLIPGDCHDLSVALEREAVQARLVESSRQTSCSRDAASQECVDLTTQSQEVAAGYKALRRRYEQCQELQSIFAFELS